MIKKGINASPGIAIAKAIVYVKKELDIVRRQIDDVAAECARFDEAVAQSREQLSALQAKTARELGEEEAAIFEDIRRRVSKRNTVQYSLSPTVFEAQIPHLQPHHQFTLPL